MIVLEIVQSLALPTPHHQHSSVLQQERSNRNRINDVTLANERHVTVTNA